MTATLGIVANVYNDCKALTGWLETHLPFADDVRVLHAGPNGEYSNDGTIELLEQWNIPTEYTSINEGFGVVRTKAIRMSPCDYVMILDADERFYPLQRILHCIGEPTPHSEVDKILQSYDFRDLKVKQPNWQCIRELGKDLTVEVDEFYDQGDALRSVLDSKLHDVIPTVRRHWHDFSFKYPTQNWHTTPDWQMRLVQNVEHIKFSTDKKMHEQLSGHSKIYYQPGYTFYFDHFHFSFKRLSPVNRSHAVSIYDSINQSKNPPTWEEFTND